MFPQSVSTYDRRTVHSVGGPFMILHHEYDPAQSWLPFVENTLFTTFEPEPAVDDPFLPDHIAKPGYLAPEARMKIRPEYRTIFLNQSLVPPEQMLLPFQEYKRVTKTAWKTLKRQNFPGWDRIDERLCSYTFKRKMANLIEQKAREVCTGCFYMSEEATYFQFSQDAVALALEFG